MEGASVAEAIGIMISLQSKLFIKSTQNIKPKLFDFRK